MTKPFLLSLLSASLLLASYSCGNDDYLTEHDVRRMIEESLRQNNEQLEFTQWKIVNIAIKKGDWQWDDDVKHYFVVCDLPELTEFIYENGANIGYPVSYTHLDVYKRQDGARAGAVFFLHAFIKDTSQ